MFGVILFFNILLHACEHDMCYKEVRLDRSKTDQKSLMTFSNDGTVCVSRIPGGTTTLYNFDSDTCEQLSLTHDARSLCASYLDASKRLLSCPRDVNTIGLYQVTNKKLLSQFSFAAEVLDTSFDEQNCKVYGVCDNQNEHKSLIVCYDVQTQKPIIDFKGVLERDEFIERICDREIMPNDRYAPKLTVNSRLGIVLYPHQHNSLTLWDTKSSQVISGITYAKSWCGTTYWQYVTDQDVNSNTHAVVAGIKTSGCGGAKVMEYDLRNTSVPLLIKSISQLKQVTVRYDQASAEILAVCGKALCKILIDRARDYTFELSTNRGYFTSIYANSSKHILRTATTDSMCQDWDIDLINQQIAQTDEKNTAFDEMQPLIDCLLSMAAKKGFEPGEWTEHDQSEYDELEARIKTLAIEKNVW